MATTKFTPQQIPFSASPELRAFLEDQIRQLKPLVNDSAQSNENQIITGDWEFAGERIGFYGTAPIQQQTAVPVTIADVHAALVNLGLIT